ncbi:hypothetical protein HOO65_100012 [Ceratocystis lukuohia]|uniref:Uncharacterized protein n=1 Tax=Ceratocystis lukuohia TaxID=2019550 RepID=A0ABR4M8K8_9PEZI
MWLPKLVQSLFMAALLSTQVMAGDKKVPLPSELGLDIPKHDENGWKEVTTSDGFYAKIFVSYEFNYIEIDSVRNPTTSFKSYEALMSIWENQSRLTVGSLDMIMYDNIIGPDMIIIDEALKMFGFDPSAEEMILAIQISRDSGHNEIWDFLSAASFAQDAVEMCDQFQDMDNRYIRAFQIGSHYDASKWVRIDFDTKSE